VSETDGKADGSLFEPLIRRERYTVALLAQGRTGPEIAGKLTLAVNSVKWHAQHLDGKLGVNSKRQALTRARELGAAHNSGPSGRTRRRAGTGTIVGRARLRGLPIAWVHAGNHRPGRLGTEPGCVMFEKLWTVNSVG
jgi:DNA-binding CsgD family transcriptional regulator